MARPRIEINWEEFDKLCSLQCTLVEIAEWFDCSEDTIERAVQREKKMGFAEYYKRKSSRGKISLRREMFKAVQNGNVTMMIWLSKNILGYTDKLQIPPPEELPAASKQSEKVSFEVFCEKAGYPKPYPKQIEMKDFGFKETVIRLLLGSRGYGKTDYVTVLGTAYKIYLDATDTTFIVTKSKTRNSAMLNEIANALEKNGVELEKRSATEIRVTGLIGKDGSVSAATIKSVSMRGRHPRRVIMDDPVTPEDVTEATRAASKRAYNEVVKLTQNVLLIGQPVHKYDLFEEIRPIVRKMEVPFGSIPELDADLEAQRVAGVDERSIQASYFLKIISEGATPFDGVHYIENGQFPKGDTVAFIDPSFEGGDFTAISIIRGYMEGVAVVGFVWQRSWDHCLDEISPLLKKYHVRRLCFETNALGSQPLDILRRVFKDVGVVGKKSNSNKHSRIMSAGQYAHMIHLSRESDGKYLDQVVKYEYKAAYDDAPDSLANCLEWIGLIRGKV